MLFRADITKPKIEINIIHDGEILSFPASAFSKKPFERGFDPFEEINQYWASKSKYFQDTIFAIYRDVNTAFDYIMNTDELYGELNDLIVQLLEHHPLSEIEMWLRTNPSIHRPETVKDALPSPTDNTKTVGKTYTVSDYYPLLALSFVLRLLTPIWGEYISSIRKNTEVDKKEYIAMQLLNGTGLLECPAMLRLRVYIDELTQSEQVIDWERVLDGFSSEDIGFLMLSLVCVRQLCLSDLRGSDPHTQIVAGIWKFLMHRVSNSEMSSVKIKESGEGEGFGSEQHSIMESYRRRTELSIGDIAEFEHAISHPEFMAKCIEPSIDLSLLHVSLESIKNIEIQNVGDPQIVIAGWVLKDYISPHALYYVCDNLDKVLAVTEAVLWHRGFKTIAAIASSYAVTAVEEISVGYINTREQLSLETLEKLKKHYPYGWTSPKKKNSGKMYGITEAIDHIADQLAFTSWRMSMSEERIIDVYKEKRRKLIIPSNIKEQLAGLIIDIENRR